MTATTGSKRWQQCAAGHISSRYSGLQKVEIVPAAQDGIRSRSQSLLAKLALLAFALLLTALFLEVGFRIAFHQSRDFSMEMWKYAVRLKRPVPNPDLSFAHVPNNESVLMGVDVKINSQGLRDYEYPLTKSSGTYRIMMLGDSTTFGWGVRLEDTAAKILEFRLNDARATGPGKFEVI